MTDQHKRLPVEQSDREAVPDAWMFQRATTIFNGQPRGWVERLTFSEPRVPPAMTRTVTPLFATTSKDAEIARLRERVRVLTDEAAQIAYRICDACADDIRATLTGEHP
jgi:hypothetical protein